MGIWVDIATPRLRQWRWREEEKALRELEFRNSLDAVMEGERENEVSTKISGQSDQVDGTLVA